ncbi:hypothetical protein IC229_32200 [Spirosoma sp. BT702]|uniref:Uncharacterized protein n=1 Tax=Spirosoma profusum TaxID=2771354 RepID=A0A927GAR6_9BACT|nr:hypothetical protein [Spirosoma profusum]MBD2705325.1 hypothetical protein [Spirosoma profusum]
MDTKIENALQHLNQLRVNNSAIKLENYENSYNLILNALPELGGEEVKAVSKRMLMFLTNENIGPVYMNQIPTDISGYLAEKHLLAISDITNLFVDLSNHFITQADQWIGEVYYYGYILYASRQDYPLSEVKQGLLGSTSEAVINFRAILQRLYDPTDDWEEAKDKIHSIIQLIDFEILPRL